MSNKIISILCEGSHDVAFLTKLLKITGFKICEGTKLKDFPKPMDSILTTEATKANVEELKLSEIKHALLPSGVLKNEDESTFFFLYALGGESRRDRRIRVLSSLIDSIPREGEFTELLSDSEICIAYFFDADDKGVSTRLGEITDEIKSVLNDEFSITENGSVIDFNGLQIGAYIFRKLEEDNGKLENILIPLMKGNNDEIFEDAEKYIEKHLNNDRVRKNNFTKDKALIGVAGQLQKSGTSNNVIITQTDYITKEKVEQDANCQEIIQFFQLLSK